MAINFPNAPSNGQIYEGYQWDAAKGAWVSGRYVAYRPATTDVAGIVELATNAETQTGTDAARAVTPAGLASRTATDARAGIVELATNAEAIARASTALAITPANLDAAMKDRALQGRIPSSVQVASGSSSTAADGTVTFTGASRVSLNGVFDGLGMDTYDIYAYFTGTAVGAVSTRMRQAGVDRTTNVYNYVGNYTVNASGPTRASVFGTSSFGFWWINFTAFSPSSYGKMTMFRPGQNTQTQLVLQSGTSASDRILWHEYGDATAAIEDGFSIQAAAGTLTGMVKVVKIA